MWPRACYLIFSSPFLKGTKRNVFYLPSSKSCVIVIWDMLKWENTLRKYWASQGGETFFSLLGIFPVLYEHVSLHKGRYRTLLLILYLVFFVGVRPNPALFLPPLIFTCSLYYATLSPFQNKVTLHINTFFKSMHPLYTRLMLYKFHLKIQLHFELCDVSFISPFFSTCNLKMAAAIFKEGCRKC